MRRIMWFTIGFACACAVGAWLFRGTLLAVLAVAALVAGGVCLYRQRKRLRPPRAAAVMLGFAVGCIWFHGFSEIRLEVPRALDGEEIVLQMEADSFGWDTDYGTACAGTATIDGREYRLQLYLREKLEIRPGDRIETTARMRLTDTGGRKDPTFHRGNGVYLLAYQRDAVRVIPGEASLRHLPVFLRQACMDRIGAAFPQDTAGFAGALVFGDKRGLSHENLTDFKVTGISHMVAVSGLHLSVLFAVCYVLARKGRFLTALIGIPCALLFAAVVGFTPSVTRSAIMLSLFMLSLAVDREYDPPTALAFAALAMLVHNPLVIASVGFEMSVGSVAGIFLFYRPIRSWFAVRLPKSRKKHGSLLQAAAASVSMTLSATALTAPLAAWYFGTFSLIGVLTNLLVLPVIGVIFCGVLLSCAVGFFPPAAAVLGWVLAWPIRYVLAVSHLLGQVPLAAVYTASPYTVGWIVFLYGLLVCLLFARRKRPVAAAALAALGLMVSLGCSWAEPFLDSYRVTVLDVGQGQCVMLQAGAHTFLVDCGGDRDEDAGDRAAELLLSMGIRHIDGLIISHYDRDHCGGAEHLARRISIERAFLPVPGRETELSGRVAAGLTDSEIIWLEQDMELTFETGRIRIFVPQNGKTDNENSAAVLFQRGKYDTLICGDLPASGERTLLEHWDLPDLEVLVAGHHGSASSTCQELLDRLAPDAVMISAGKNNPYGHPAREVLQRLEAAGCAVFRTDRMGTITYRR